MEVDEHESLRTLYHLVAQSTGVSPLRQSLFDGDNLLDYDGTLSGSGPGFKIRGYKELKGPKAIRSYKGL